MIINLFRSFDVRRYNVLVHDDSLWLFPYLTFWNYRSGPLTWPCPCRGHCCGVNCVACGLKQCLMKEVCASISSRQANGALPARAKVLDEGAAAQVLYHIVSSYLLDLSASVILVNKSGLVMVVGGPSVVGIPDAGPHLLQHLQIYRTQDNLQDLQYT